MEASGRGKYDVVGRKNNMKNHSPDHTWKILIQTDIDISSVQFSRTVVSNFLQPHGPQHARIPCPSPTPGACSNSCPSSLWWNPIISSSVIRKMTNTSLKRSSISPIIREMQPKTSVRHHFTYVDMTVIKKTRDNKSWWTCGKKRHPHALLVGM